MKRNSFVLIALISIIASCASSTNRPETKKINCSEASVEDQLKKEKWVNYDKFLELSSSHFTCLDKDNSNFLESNEFPGQYDHDKDGKVSIIEYTNYQDEMFKKYDLSGNNFLDATEIKKVTKE